MKLLGKRILVDPVQNDRINLAGVELIHVHNGTEAQNASVRGTVVEAAERSEFKVGDVVYYSYSFTVNGMFYNSMLWLTDECVFCYTRNGETKMREGYYLVSPYVPEIKTKSGIILISDLTTEETSEASFEIDAKYNVKKLVHRQLAKIDEMEKTYTEGVVMLSGGDIEAGKDIVFDKTAWEPLQPDLYQSLFPGLNCIVVNGEGIHFIKNNNNEGTEKSIGGIDTASEN